MDDVELVAAVRAGDREAFGEIYDRYAPRLLALCTRLLNEPHTAADAVQDTFVLASRRLDQLRDATKLRPWLYAIARNECTRHGRARARLVPVEEQATVSTDEVDDPGNRAASADVGELLWAAAEGLDERDRVLLELSVRHGLEGQELAEAAGVSPGQISMATGRMRDRVERSLGALLVARQGRADCPGLQATLAGWDGTFSVLWRKRVARHVDSCDRCERTRAALVAPLGSLALTPLVLPFDLPPLALRVKVLAGFDAALAGGPMAAGPDLPAMAEHWPGGFPPVDPGAPDPARRRVLVPVAAVLVLLLLAVGAVVVGTRDDGDGATEVATGNEVSSTTPSTAGATEPAAPSPPTGSTTTTGPGTTTTVPAATTAPAPATTTTVPVPVTVGQPPSGPAAPPATTQPEIAFPDPTTTTPVPNERPAVGTPTRSPEGNLQTTCNPANSTRQIEVTITDDRGVGSVRLRWSGIATGSKPMSRVGETSTWTATLGPFAEVGELRYRVAAVDSDGAERLSPLRTVPVDPCPG